MDNYCLAHLGTGVQYLDFIAAKKEISSTEHFKQRTGLEMSWIDAF